MSDTYFTIERLALCCSGAILFVLTVMSILGKRSANRRNPDQGGNGGGGRPPGNDMPDPQGGVEVDFRLDDHPRVTAFDVRDPPDVRIPAPHPGRVTVKEIPAHEYGVDVPDEIPTQIEWGAFVQKEHAKRE